MTVYVDNMQAPFGRMVMCHCWADTREELFAMMDAIGVQRKWFQEPPKASWEHFDIAMSKRALAVKYGAVEVDMMTMAEHANRQQFIVSVNAGNMDRAFHYLKKLCWINAVRNGRNVED